MIKTKQNIEATVLRWGKTESAGHFGNALEESSDLLYVTSWVTDADELAVMIGENIDYMQPGDEIVIVEGNGFVRAAVR